MKKTNFLKNLGRLLVSLSIIMAGFVSVVQGKVPPSYELTDLGFLPCEDFPGTYCNESEVNAINEVGSIVGDVEVPEPHCFHAGLYRNGEWRELGILGAEGKSFGALYFTS